MTNNVCVRLIEIITKRRCVMKKLFYLIFIVALLGSCGGTEEPSGDNGGNGATNEDGSTEEGGSKGTERDDRGNEQLSPEEVAVLNSNLLVAAEEGNAVAVKEALDAGADVNVKGDREFRALHLAVKNGHTEVVKLLLDTEGIEVDAVNSVGVTALMLAARGNLELTRLLLQHNANINAKTENGNTARTYAIYAIQQGNKENQKVVDLLESYLNISS